jgi:predicted transposase YbfD/YdcC
MMEILEGYCINLDKLIEKEGTCRYLPFAYHIFEVLNEKERQYLTACIKHDYVKDAVMLDIPAADRSRKANIESIMTTITDLDSQYMRDCKKFLMEVDNRLLNLTKPDVAEKAVDATSSSPTDTKKAKAPTASRKRKVENDDKTGDTADAGSKSQKKFITKTRRHWTVASSRRIVNSVDFTDFFNQFVDIISRVHGNTDSIIQKLSTICINEEMNECVDILRQKEANDVVKKQKELDDINKLAAIAAETSTSGGGGAVDDTADINDQLNDEDKMEMENNDPLDGAGGKKQSNKAISSKIFNDRYSLSLTYLLTHLTTYSLTHRRGR